MTGASKPGDEPGPAVGAGAVVFRGDDVLLVRRAKPPLEGQWSLPGGRVRAGERAAEAALRELAEETGTQGDVIGLAGVFDFIGEGHHYVLIDYAVRWTHGEPRAGDDATEARFFTPGDLAGLGLWEETLRAIALGRALLQRSESER